MAAPVIDQAIPLDFYRLELRERHGSQEAFCAAGCGSVNITRVIVWCCVRCPTITRAATSKRLSLNGKKERTPMLDWVRIIAVLLLGAAWLAIVALVVIAGGLACWVLSLLLPAIN